jgi:hypothetical protein
MISSGRQSNDSTKSSSHPAQLQTAYEFYEEKFENFKLHVAKIASYYSGVKPWSDDINKINLAVFIQISGEKFKVPAKYHAENEFELRDEHARDVFIDTAQEMGFALEDVRDEDMVKLTKYAILFSIMLSD